jgi:hypothetical protein
MIWKSIFATAENSPYVDESKLDSRKIIIRTRRPVIITMTTIPARLTNALKIIKHFLKHVQGVEKFILNVPYKYKRWPSFSVDVKHSIKDPRFVINRCEDVGPMTKFLPTLDIVQDNAILIICDDMCYKLDAFKDLAERQEMYPDRAFSFYVYDYKPESSSSSSSGTNLKVPQGADLISVMTNNMRGFPGWFDNFVRRNKITDYKRDSDCFFVDDQVIAWYFHDSGIRMEQYERKHRNIYIKDCEMSDKTQNLNQQGGVSERTKVMERCFIQMDRDGF